MARRRAGGRPVARDRRRARDTRTVGLPTARIAVIVNQTVSEGKKGNGESLGQLGGASLSNCRELRAEGESTRSLVATSQKTPLSVKRELYRREPMRTQRAKRQALEQSVPWRHSIP